MASRPRIAGRACPERSRENARDTKQDGREANRAGSLDHCRPLFDYPSHKKSVEKENIA